jgi:hypothetical protein
VGSRWIPRITASGGGGQGPPGPPGPDHFAPKYLIGNILAGDDPVGFNLNGFRYIPDPGDGSGIALALTQPNGPGDIWVRPGTYTKTQARFVIPSNVRVWGSGYTTVIIASAIDNTIWEVGDRAELAWMYNTHPGPLAGAGAEVILCLANVTYVHDLAVDASASSAGGILVAGVAYSGIGGGGPVLSRLYNNVLVGPQQGTGVFDPAAMYANIRGLPLAQNDTVLVDVQSNTLIAGDAGLVGLGVTGQVPAQGVSFIVGRAIIVGPAVIGFYNDFSPLLASTGPSVVLCFAATTVAGAIALNAFQYEFGSVLFLNLTDQGQGPVAVPGIIVSEPAAVPGNPTTSVNIHECTLLFWGDPSDPQVPQVLLGEAAELVVSAHVANNRFISNPSVTPILFGAGCTDSIALLNTSQGSGGTFPIDVGAGNEIAHNIWT